jgi:hypothetical protein
LLINYPLRRVAKFLEMPCCARMSRNKMVLNNAPGCPNQLVEIHHIHEWHVYQTHDASHMIAICPSCHDAVDRGSLQISDDELYRWKGIDRKEALSTGHIFIEPGEAPRLLLGSLVVTR